MGPLAFGGSAVDDVSENSRLLPQMHIEMVPLAIHLFAIFQLKSHLLLPPSFSFDTRLPATEGWEAMAVPTKGRMVQVLTFVSHRCHCSRQLPLSAPLRQLKTKTLARSFKVHIVSPSVIGAQERSCSRSRRRAATRISPLRLSGDGDGAECAHKILRGTPTAETLNLATML